MADKWRILVVDDDEDTRRLIAATLQTKYEVVEAFDGLDALTKVEIAEPDFIVMDVKMPLLDGYEACRAITRNPRYRDLNVMFLSGMDDKRHIKKGYEAGGSLYLTKPIDPMRLLKNIDLYFEETPPPRKDKRKPIELIQQEIEKQNETEAEDRVHEADTVRDFSDESKGEQPADKPADKPAPKDSRRERACNRYKQPRVMVIDDDPDIISLVRMSLKNRVEVVWADDSAAAVEKLARYEPDVLLLDIMMPKFSGYQLLQFIRRNAVFKTLPVIVVSAKTSHREVAYAKRMGADSYLTKPFDPEQLIKTVDSFVTSPGFTVRKKKIEYSAILAEVSEEGGSPFEEVDEEHRYIAKDGHQKLRKFISEHMKDDEEENEDEVNEEKPER